DLEAFLSGGPVSARESSLAYFVSRIFRETHHAPVMENWGGLWMVHSLKLLLLCVATNVLWVAGVRDHLAYLVLWSIALIGWGALPVAVWPEVGPTLFGLVAALGFFVPGLKYYRLRARNER